jgi:hypothetical protein
VQIVAADDLLRKRSGMMRVRSPVASGVLAALAGASLGISPAAGSQSSFTFHATVSGKGHDAGTITAPEHATNVFDQTGCAIVKQRGTAKTLRGAYTFVVRFIGRNPVIEPGMKPKGPWVLLEVDHFRPSVSTYRRLDVSGSFTINGRTYGGGAIGNSVVRVGNGGRDGTWTEPKATRSYPPLASGFRFQATWHCNTVFHLTGF